MLEEYFIKQFEELKKENQELKEEIQKRDNKFIIMEEQQQIKAKLIVEDLLFKRLDEEGINLNKIVDEMGSKEIKELIKNLGLYREIKNDDYEAIIKMNGKLYGLEKYYNDYKLCRGVYVELDDVIYNDLVDDLYDKVRFEIDRRKQGEEEIKK